MQLSANALFSTTSTPCPLLCAALQGWALANDMLVLGRKLTADEALRAGLVSRVLTADTREGFLYQARGIP